MKYTKIIIESKEKMRKKIASIAFVLLSTIIVSHPAKAKTPVRLSSMMNTKQMLLRPDFVYPMKGFTWSGECGFWYIVTPIQKSGDTTLVRLDQIIRVWYANEKGYWAIRETDCRRFPCTDSKGKQFNGILPVKEFGALGDTFYADNSTLTSSSTLSSKETGYPLLYRD